MYKTYTIRHVTSETRRNSNRRKLKHKHTKKDIFTMSYTIPPLGFFVYIRVFCFYKNEFQFNSISRPDRQLRLAMLTAVYTYTCLRYTPNEYLLKSELHFITNISVGIETNTKIYTHRPSCKLTCFSQTYVISCSRLILQEILKL